MNLNLTNKKEHDLSASPQPGSPKRTRPKKVTTMEQKRMKRKVLKVFETEGDEIEIKKKLNEELPMPSTLATDPSFELELKRFKQSSPSGTRTAMNFASYIAANSGSAEQKKLNIARMGRQDIRDRVMEKDTVLM